MNPPLRSKADVDAILQGIADGTLSILCSDHAPHAEFEKEVEFDQAPFGIVGLETELGIFIDLLVHKHRKIDITRLIEMYTVEPSKLLKLHAGTLSVGAAADVTLIDPDLEWTVRIDKFESASRNSPFDGWKLRGRALRTIVRGNASAALRRSGEFACSHHSFERSSCFFAAEAPLPDDWLPWTISSVDCGCRALSTFSSGSRRGRWWGEREPGSLTRAASS